MFIVNIFIIIYHAKYTCMCFYNVIFYISILICIFFFEVKINLSYLCFSNKQYNISCYYDKI